MLIARYILYLFVEIIVSFLFLLSILTLNTFSAVLQEKSETSVFKILSTEEIEKKWGVRPLSIREAANGYMIDFRYRVIDDKRAAPLFNPKIKPYLIDQKGKAVMYVPNVPKVGSMRSTRKPFKDRNYAILFANPGKYIKPGNKVTVVIGELRIDNLVVE